jgi:hypothetical protein
VVKALRSLALERGGTFDPPGSSPRRLDLLPSPSTAFAWTRPRPAPTVPYLVKSIAQHGCDPVPSVSLCAYPATPGSGAEWVFIISEDHVLYRSRHRWVGVPETFPTQAELASFWGKLD